MNENDLRQAFALMLTIGLAGDLMSDNLNPKTVWNLADAMVEAGKKIDDEQELGIAAVKPKRVYTRKTYNR